MYQVQKIRHGIFVCDVGTPVDKQKAQQIIDAAYRADWESTGRVTPITHYTMIDVVTI